MNSIRQVATKVLLISSFFVFLFVSGFIGSMVAAQTLPTAQPVSIQASKVTHILFGSCSHQDKAMPIFNAILQEPADAFIFLGDNIYGDTEDMQELAQKYNKLGQDPGVKALKSKVAVYAIWDDHDFGENDAGKQYPFKAESKKVMLDFWDVAKDSPRRSREDGIYGSYLISPDNADIQNAGIREAGIREAGIQEAGIQEADNSDLNAIRLILPDLRYMRDDLESVSLSGYETDRKLKDMGPYKHSKGSMLSEQQWQWLEIELQQPERIKIIGSSLQLIADFTGWESWANFNDRQRLFDLIKKHKVNGVFIISGDTHWGEISKFDTNMDYPLWDITSSGLTEEWKQVSPNQHRILGYTDKVNYGFFTVNWDLTDPSIHFGLKDVNGAVVMQQNIALSSLSPYQP
ncbi:MAG: alkaline phosphatase D [Bermanella sp.]|jgi:alkaline phosphatase D